MFIKKYDLRKPLNIQSFCRMELWNVAVDFALENFINTNSCFENYFKSDHTYTKKTTTFVSVKITF